MYPLLIAAAAAMPHTALDRVLQEHVNATGEVDYEAIQQQDALNAYLTSLADVAEPSDPDAQLAFWINAYNAATIDLIADHYPLQSIRELDGGNPWDARRFVIAKKRHTLNQIQHRELKPIADPRFHAAISCASKGCPPLRQQAYTAESIDQQLDTATRVWLTNGGALIDRESQTVQISRIFEWYPDDFPNTSDIPGISGPQEAAINFIAQFLPEHADWLLAGGYDVSFQRYDWSLNDQTDL